MSFLGLAGKNVVVMGVANRKSVAWAVGQTLEAEGAKVLYTVRSETRRENTAALLGDRPVWVCDVEKPDEIAATADAVGRQHGPVHGLVHSIAFANYRDGFTPFHETNREDFLQATAISCFSLADVARAFKPHFAPDASVVAVSISSLLVTAEAYGYMSPIKAALDSTVRQLAKSFSADTSVRFNTVNPGPLKTSASAGIPGYLENYLYAEKMTFRKRAVQTQEVANAVVFLLSARSSGINGAGLVIDAGLGLNYFDRELVRLAMRPEER